MTQFSSLNYIFPLLNVLAPKSDFETYKLFAQTAYDFSQKEIAPLNAEMDRKNATSPQLWSLTGKQGLSAPTIAEQYNGMGSGYLLHLLYMEPISEASGSFGLSYGACTNLFGNQIQLNGSEQQKQKYLPKIANGEWVGALAMSEPNAGSDVMSMKCSAVLDGDHYVLNGEKLWITNGGIADALIVYAKTEPSLGSKGITAFIIDKGTQGFMPGKKLDKTGMRGSETYPLYFNDCRVPVKNILGEINGGTKVLMSGLNKERLVLSGGPLGIACAALSFTRNFLETREQFNRPVVTNQVVAHKLAEMHSNLLTVHSHVYLNAALSDQTNQLANDTAASVLYEATITGSYITETCEKLCAGMGYTTDLPLGQYSRDMKLYPVGAGTENIRLDVIAREMSSAYNEHVKRVDNYYKSLTRPAL